MYADEPAAVMGLHWSDVLLGAVPRLASPGAAPNNTPLDERADDDTWGDNPRLATKTWERQSGCCHAPETPHQGFQVSARSSSGGAGGVPPWAGSSPPPLEPLNTHRRADAVRSATTPKVGSPTAPGSLRGRAVTACDVAPTAPPLSTEPKPAASKRPQGALRALPPQAAA